MRLIFIAVSAMTAILGCNQASFRSEKAAVLESKRVFTDDVAGAIHQGGGGAEETGFDSAPAPAPAPSPVYDPGPIVGERPPPSNPPEREIEVVPDDVVLSNSITNYRGCWDGGTVTEGITPIIMSSNLTLKVSVAGEVKCTVSGAAVRSEIEKENTNLYDLCGQSFIGLKQVTVSLTNEKNEQMIYADLIYGKVAGSPLLYLLYGDNPQDDLTMTGMGPLSSNPEDYLKCHVIASPLFVDLRARDGAFELTSRRDGVWFDIFGENARPVPYGKKRISWFKDSAMAMLTLPDGNGQVAGINQLFGDNTRGPDGKFADNGFLALAKYDHGDGVIDQRDEVYSRLSLWIDRDLNAIAGPGELMSLDYLGLTSIDLVYDPNFAERDRYGNEIKYKSVVNFADGSMKLIYDLWFLTENY